VLETATPRSLLHSASYLNLIITNMRRRSRSSRHISDEMRNNLSTLFVNIVIVISILVTVLMIVPDASDYAYLVGGSSGLFLLLLATGSLLLIVPAMKSIWTRTIRLVDVSTSEAMLGTRSAEVMGYNATSRALKLSILSIYVLIGFVIVSPMVGSMIQQNLLFTIIALAIVAVVVIALWSSVQTINSKLSEVFESRGPASFGGDSRDLEEIEEIIAMLERDKG